MNREQKAAAVQDIADELQSAEAVFAVDYRGISVPQAAELRARLRDADATFRIVKNSLTERAADKAGAESLRSLLEGPTALTFVRGDAALAAKALADFARTRAVLDFKGGLMGGEELTAEQIRAIARLPAREVLYAQMVGTVAAPLTGLVRGLNGLVAGLAVQLQQIVDQGLLPQGQEGAAPAPTEPEPAEEPATAEAAAEAEAEPEVESTEGPPPAEGSAEAETEPEVESPEGPPPAEGSAEAEAEPEVESTEGPPPTQPSGASDAEAQPDPGAEKSEDTPNENPPNDDAPSADEGETKEEA